jgi:hypothetical protein
VIWVDSSFRVNENGQGDSLRDSSASPTNKVFFSKQRVKIMKGRSILSLMANLTILGIGAFIKPQSVSAEPASIFRPFIRDIKSQLPRGMVMRLPASIPYRSLPASSNNTLYPYLYSKNGELGITLYYSPGCRANPCFAGEFIVSKLAEHKSKLEAIAKWSCANTVSVNIKPGIQGVYTNIRCGGTGDGSQTIFWKQNGLTFSAQLRAAANIKQELLEIATSMANEPPIQSVR